MSSRRFIFFEGGIGVGKTYMMNQLEKKIKEKVKFIYEFIDDDALASSMLNNFISRNISIPKFQHFILDYWDRKLEELNNNDNLIIMERGPCGGTGFVKPYDFDTSVDAMNFYCRIQQINKKFDIKKPKVITISNNFNIDNLINIIFSSNENLLFFIFTPFDVQKENIIKRGRLCESSYTDNYLKKINKGLFNLYYSGNLLDDFLYDIKG